VIACYTKTKLISASKDQSSFHEDSLQLKPLSTTVDSRDSLHLTVLK